MYCSYALAEFLVSTLFGAFCSCNYHACTVCRLQSLVPKHNLLIASYDIVRNDIDYFM